jgi:hypothetical protein
MGKKYFEITVTKVTTAKLELDDAVIDAVDDEWRSQLYQLHEPEEIAEMIGRCMILYDSQLSSLDGWRDQPDKNARLFDVDDDVETEVQAIEAPNKA